MQPQLRSAGRIALGAMTGLFIGGMTISPSSAVQLPNGQFEDSNSAMSCSGSLCYVAFQQVPPFKTATITNLSCQITTTSPASIVDAVLASIGNPRGAHFIPVLTAASTTGRVYLANAAVLHYVTAFDRPTITLSTKPGKLWKIDCTIVGTVQ